MSLGSISWPLFINKWPERRIFNLIDGLVIIIKTLQTKCASHANRLAASHIFSPGCKRLCDSGTKPNPVNWTYESSLSRATQPLETVLSRNQKEKGKRTFHKICHVKELFIFLPLLIAFVPPSKSIPRGSFSSNRRLENQLSCTCPWFCFPPFGTRYMKYSLKTKIWPNILNIFSGKY